MKKRNPSTRSRAANPSAIGRKGNDFSARTKRDLADRVGHRCSHPQCRQPTSGPRKGSHRAANSGMAAHITAAAVGAPQDFPGMRIDVKPGLRLVVESHPQHRDRALLVMGMKLGQPLAPMVAL